MQQKSRFSFTLLAGLVILSLALAACQPAATPEPTDVPAAAPTEAPTDVPAPTEAPTAVPEPTEEPEPEVGSPEHPIKVLFVPSVEADVITTGGELMANALNEATGLTFEVSIPTSYAATIEEMCASPTDTIGFIPALGYVLANQLCGVDVEYKAIRRGFSVYWAAFFVARDSEFQTIEDLEGATWGYTDPASTSGYMVPVVMLDEAGITVSESVETGGHPQAIKAVYNGEVDFGTAFYSPPDKPEGEEPWKEGDPVDIPDELVDSCEVLTNADGSVGNLVCGEWNVLDARRNIREEAPDVVQKVRVLAISPSIPNDTMSFGPDFPAELREQISAALAAFAETDAWADSIGNQDFYGWDGIEPTTDEEYDFTRLMVEAAGITMENIGQ